MKKLFLTILAVFGLVVAFSACGGSEGTSAAQQCINCTAGSENSDAATGGRADERGAVAGDDSATGGKPGRTLDNDGDDDLSGTAGKVNAPVEETGGASSAGTASVGSAGDPSPTGGSNATGGTPDETGGSDHGTGGNAQTGGSQATGGSSPGGSNATGGTPDETGGSDHGTGGNAQTGGSQATGGSSPGGSNAAGANPTGGASPVCAEEDEPCEHNKDCCFIEDAFSFGCSNGVCTAFTAVECGEEEDDCLGDGDCCAGFVCGEEGLCEESEPPGTGGAPGTGGSSSTGGSTEETGGNPGTGGSSSTPKPFVCSKPVSDSGFESLNFDVVDSVWASAPDDIDATVGYIGGPGKLVNYDGSEWTEQELNAPYPVTSMKAVHGDGNVVLAGGSWDSGGKAPYAALFRKTAGAWAPETVSSMTMEDEIVRRVWTYQGLNVVVTDTYASSPSWNANIFIKKDGVWMNTVIPSCTGPRRIMDIYGVSENEVYAVGGNLALDEFGFISGWSGAILWRFDGSSWLEITTLPSDLLAILGIHGNADGEIYVVGRSNESGVRLVTTDLAHWTRSNATTAWETAIATPRVGAAISGGNLDEAAISVSSEQSWGSPELLGEKQSGVWGITFVTGSSEVLIASQRKKIGATLFRMTCQ